MDIYFGVWRQNNNIEDNSHHIRPENPQHIIISMLELQHAPFSRGDNCQVIDTQQWSFLLLMQRVITPEYDAFSTNAPQKSLKMPKSVFKIKCKFPCKIRFGKLSTYYLGSVVSVSRYQQA